MSHLRSYLCFVGWHKWEYKDVYIAGHDVTKTRCANWRCRQHVWRTVNIEKINRPWR